MMSFSLRSLKTYEYASLAWHESQAVPSVRFAIRRITLTQRLELAKRIRDLSLREEFLKAGGTPEQLESSICDLLTRKALIEWGLAAVTGIRIDGQSATAQLIIDKGPESLTDEIVSAIQREAGLSGTRKKKLLIAFHFQFASSAAWNCENCRKSGLVKRRNCAWIGIEPPADAKPIWDTSRCCGEAVS